MCFSTTKSSASLGKAGVSEIGLKCLVMLETGFSLGIGVMSACFHARGSFCSLFIYLFLYNNFIQIITYNLLLLLLLLLLLKRVIEGRNVILIVNYTPDIIIK